MADKTYTASKSRTQGRDSWAVIFRHPARLDLSGKVGRRIRRGLGTSDEVEAERLIGQLNELLRAPELWEPSARSTAASRFDPLVVDIFFDGIEAQRVDFEEIRDELLPLPGADADYRRVLLLGTTGAGKTTLVRQLLGTDPETERFPSTSTAKTTIADTELVFDDSPLYRSVVTFVGREEVVDYLTECVYEAALAIFRKASSREVRRRLLDHPNQRFRFSYVLGRGLGDVDDEDVDDDDLDLEFALGEQSAPDTALIDVDKTAEVIGRSVESLESLVADHEAGVRSLLKDTNDERVLEELIEETLDDELRSDERFQQIVDDLFDEVERRFELLTIGDVRRSRQGWPVSWSWETDDREALLKAVTRFSSNYARLFGTLLTPLVNGMRISGPFQPTWLSESTPKLVLIDGEGLGHAPNSAAALSTSVSKRIEEVDAVLLVDNATQPMQAAPVAAIKALITSGNASKLVFCFTHFDMVKGDNLPTFSEREAHIRASVENVLKAIGEDLGPFAERVLRQRLERSCFFCGGIDETLQPSTRAGRRSIEQLTALLDSLDHIIERPETTEIRPVYDRVNLVLAVREAAIGFHELWRARLGLEFNAQIPREHWGRIKALSRRFAEAWADEYDKLKPVAELKRELDEQIYRMLGQPLRWEGGEPTDDEKQQIIDELANAIAKEIQALASRRLDDERRRAWREAFAQEGTGSTSVRARIISADVYDRAVPVPNVTPSLDQNTFLHEVTAVVDALANEFGIKLL